MSQHGILAIVSAAQRANLNLVFAAMAMGPDTFSRRITTDDPATTGSAVTHYGMYNAAALAGDALLYDNAKGGVMPALDSNGQPISWGLGGVIGEADALAAFGAMQFWLNSSDMQPPDFAAAIMGQAGLSYVPDEL